MSPEQARGLSIDKRADIWAFGCVLYEALSGCRAFDGATASDSIARILEREPDWLALPSTTPMPVQRLIRRCLAKDSRQRLRDIGDARLEIQEICGSGGKEQDATPARGRMWPVVALVTALTLAMGVGFWQASSSDVAENPFVTAQFSNLTDWEGMETNADISPDGRFAVFLSDRAGELDLWWTQVGTGDFKNLTEDVAPLDGPGVLRTFGFSGDGAEVWFGAIGRPNMLMPQTGGAPRPFLADDAKALAWSGDGSDIAYFTLSGGRDPLLIADRTGGDARRLEITPSDATEWSGIADSRGHNHNPVWSPDKQWIYFVHGVVRDWNHSSDEMDIWRIRPAGGAPERLTRLNTAITFVAPIDSRTLLFIAPSEDGSGSWLWSLNLRTQVTRRVISGLEQFTSVSVSRNGSRIVATRADPIASLWTVPLLDRPADDGDARPYAIDLKRAHAPRFGGTALFYLSARGTGDGLWRLADGGSFEVHRAADGILLQAPAPSRDGLRVAVVRKRDNKHLLTIMSANGTNARTLAPTLDAQGTADWSPDGKWLVTGGIDANGHQGLYKIAVEGDQAVTPVQLADGEAINPVWSPDGETIVYAGPFARGQASLFAVRPDRAPVNFPSVRVSPGGYRFLPDGTGLVYLPRPESRDLWLLELNSQKSRLLTHFGQHGTIRRFDITPDGKHIVFDRVRQNSDIILIDR
jgi:Tol biopolymer transport system component